MIATAYGTGSSRVATDGEGAPSSSWLACDRRISSIAAREAA